MAIYSLIEYTTTVLSQKFLQYPGDLQYLYWDLCLNFFFILFVGNTATADKLTPERPRSSLFSFTNMFQMIIIFGIQVAGQISIIAIFEAYDSSYYWANGGMAVAQQSYINNNNSFSLGLECNLLYLFTNNIYVITMAGYNISKPWREGFWTNIPLMIVIGLTLFYNHVILFWQQGTWVLLFDSVWLPDYNSRWLIFGVSWAFGLLMFFLQKAVQPLTNYLVIKYPDKKWL